MPETDPRRVRRRLTWRYVVALASIALTVTAAYGVVRTALHERAEDSRVVNLAGRQRMLSQRIAKGALVARADAGGSRAALDADVREWAAVHRGLLDGDDARGLPGVSSPATHAALDALTDEVERVRNAVGALGDALDAGDGAAADRAVNALLRYEGRFLGGMDRVVFALDAESAAALRGLWSWVGVAWVVLMALLVALGRFVFRPAIHGIARSMEEAESRGRLLQTVVDTIPDHIYVKDARGRSTLRNRASARALGVERPGDVLGRTDADVLTRPGAAVLAAAALADDLRVVRTGEPILNKEERGVDGGWLLTTKVPLRDGGGGVVGLVGVSRDVTEAREAAAQFRGLVEHSVAGTVIVQDGHYVYANPRMAEIFGYDEGEMAGLPALAVIHADDREAVADALRGWVGDRAETATYAARGVSKDGRTVYVELAGVAGEHGGRPAVIGTVVDVTAREEMERALFHQAHHDELTGLPNRALFAMRLEVAVARSKRDGDFAVLFVDLDRFKEVNDTLGHSAGDQLLQEIGRRLRRVARPSDTVARLGGDEFAVLLVGLPAPGYAEDVAEQIRVGLREPVVLDGQDVVAGASIGVVTSRADHASPDAVLREADLAMYDAKRAGRGRASTYRAADPTARRPRRGTCVDGLTPIVRAGGGAGAPAGPPRPDAVEADGV